MVGTILAELPAIKRNRTGKYTEAWAEIEANEGQHTAFGFENEEDARLFRQAANGRGYSVRTFRPGDLTGDLNEQYVVACTFTRKATVTMPHAKPKAKRKSKGHTATA